ncbi:BID domain-containing T4SS effector [Bartonella sp. CB175]|uniref:BID domain-containing T4SS effector n=1 Tax=Bartonella sp. CB175 TaxID=3112256 RepID=UPI00300E6CC6
MKRAKKTPTTSSDNYLYPNTTTLKNKHGIINKKAFNQRCALDSEIALSDIRQEPLPDKFDTDYLMHLHYSLFYRTFEWAGITRDIPFTFTDGTTAAMPRVKKKESDFLFANGPEIKNGLRDLDQSLADWNYLQNLSREDFANTAAQMFGHLNQVHPFREGNGRTQRLFFERLAQSVGHSLDFSLVTQERMNTACNIARQYGDPRYLQWMFEDISNPDKTTILKEFIDFKTEAGKKVLKKSLVVVAEEGASYTGVYEHVSPNGFVINVDGTYVVCSLDHLTPEQLKTFKIGDEIHFTTPREQDISSVLIPKEELRPLTKSEICEQVVNNVHVQNAKRNVENFSGIVYGNAQILNQRMDMINENPRSTEQLAHQIMQSPQSVGKLQGRKFCFLKNTERTRAEEHVQHLGHAIEAYIDAVKHARNEILTTHKQEQIRCGQEILMPSQTLLNSLEMSARMQLETLESSSRLQRELQILTVQMKKRFSPEDNKAINEKDFKKLAKSLGTSIKKAEKIALCFDSALKAQRNLDCSPLYAKVMKKPHQQKAPKAMALAS